jgi:Holliday junction resolvase RusA-like endonuclease
MIQFWVPGIPQPGGSKKGFVNPSTKRVVIVDDAKRNKEWRSVVAMAAREAYQGVPLDCPLSVRVCFYLPRPRGHYRTGKNAGQLLASAPAFPTKKPDSTKLWRSTEDALSGILWRDDSQVVRQVVEKKFAGEEAGQPGAWIEVKEAKP